ncbi:MAG TPA: T9SS type A sorting domain-containing protein, partial [Candidatus Marinimicrobia bacterium]|nr:T9SS type A sorting domain-containing protein [Candidatus Neomarinimicrobiota bacterium]
VSVLLAADDELALPMEFALQQNYPNPFNPSTQVRYALPEEAYVVLTIYDMMGRKVRTLVNGVEPAGYQSVLWNATSNLGLPVSAGVYICTIQAGDHRQNMKMILLK